MEKTRNNFINVRQYVDTAVDAYMWHADLLTVLAFLLQSSPSAERLRFFCESHLFAQMPDCASDVLVAEGVELDLTISAWSCAENWIQQEQNLRREHFRILVGAGRPAAPPWSGYYRQGEHLLFGEEALKDGDWYAACGLVTDRRGIPEDALSYELEFLAWLLERGDFVQAERYLSLRITPWLTQWRRDVERAGGCFYPFVARLIGAAIESLGAQMHETNCN